MAPSTSTTPPPSAQQPTISTTLPPSAHQPTISTTSPPKIDTTVLESSHESQPDALLPPPIVRMTIWPNGQRLYRPPMVEVLEDVREHHNHLTIWLRSDIKKALCVHWETDEGFKHRHITNRASKASFKSSKYIGGSANFMKTKAKLSKSLDREAMMVETFKYTHTLKENKERFANQQAADHYEPYTQRLEATTQQSQCIGDDGNNSAESVVDPDRVWCKAASEPYENHMYGLRSFFVDNLRTSTLTQSFASATSRPVDPEDDIDLKEQVLLLIEPSPTGSGAVGV
ncbi:hypothetical protein Ahy_B03g067263 [Arachis hypogaea]|uniref:Uncharacterized protein n=1 Tax=Arachis hypogaea TaxID=3818 RepID=A0A445A693_ARAHY|nr:hypothetical protein Ahy_B03g067263 [Arachis hypogaea]